MRYYDPERPESMYADSAKLQANGSPLPVITLVRPIETERAVGRREDGSQILEPCTGWLACIHAHHAEARFGYYTAIIADLAKFHADYLDDPERALLAYFRYAGPEARRARPQVNGSSASVDELWESER